MTTLGKRSLEKLSTAHPKLQLVLKEAIKSYDCMGLYGTRTVEEQFELYKKCR